MPASSPLRADGDGDGAWDVLERRMGTNPLSAASKPTTFRGGIGINFVTQGDLRGRLGTHLLAGLVPQFYWNDTRPIQTVNRASGGTADILTPLAGQIVRSDGTVLPNVKFAWTGSSTTSSGNDGTPDQKLMNGFIRASTTVPATLVAPSSPSSAPVVASSASVRC